MKHCSHCGNSNTETSRFCSSCGYNLDEFTIVSQQSQIEQVEYCHHCGNPNPSTSKNCRYCGFTFNDISNTPQQLYLEHAEYCYHCGNPNPSTSKICSFCGHKLDGISNVLQQSRGEQVRTAPSQKLDNVALGEKGSRVPIPKILFQAKNIVQEISNVPPKPQLEPVKTTQNQEQEYLAIAKKVSPKYQFQEKNLVKIGGFSLVIGIILLMLFFILFAAGSNQEIPQSILLFYSFSMMGALALTCWPLVIIPFVWLIKSEDWKTHQRQKIISEKISEIEKQRPGFTQFYYIWDKQNKEKQAENNKKLLNTAFVVIGAIFMFVIAIIGGALSAAAEAEATQAKEDRARRIVRDAVRDEINSRR